MSNDFQSTLAHYGVKGMKWGVRRSRSQLDRANIPPSPFKVGQKINDLPHQAITKSDVRFDNDARQKVRDGADLTKSALKSLTDGPPRVLGYSPTMKKVITGDDIDYPTKTKGYDPLVGTPSGFDVKSAKKSQRRQVMRALGLAAAATVAGASYLRQSDDSEFDETLAHYGVKGMKWGVRRSPSQLAEASAAQKKPGGKIVTKGGGGKPASADALNAAKIRQTAKASRTDALSNAELQEAIKRMQLEQQYSQLSKGTENAGLKFVKRLLGDTGQQQAQSVFQTQAAYQVDQALIKRGQPIPAKSKYKFKE